MSAREHQVRVRLNDQELARLDELRGDEERAVHLRRLLHEPPSGNEVATHTEALTILNSFGPRRPHDDGDLTRKGAQGRSASLGAGGVVA